jgi:hypothetical protein
LRHRGPDKQAAFEETPMHGTLVRLVALAGLAGAAAAAEAPPRQGLLIEDIFGRRLNERGLVLVDWDGYMANPAIKFFLTPPAGAALPARAVLSAREPRLYFNLPSQAGPEGPCKEVVFRTPEKAAVHVSIFPDRDGKDEDHTLKIAFTDADGKKQTLSLPVHVLDLDRDRPPAFRITTDFSQDRTGFFKEQAHRAVLRQAADDWAAIMGEMHLQGVAAGAERTLIWELDGFKKSQLVTNAQGYTGYLLYAYGIKSDLLRSGGEPSAAGSYQSGEGGPLPLRRSGGVEIEVQGNYNRKGWLVELEDSQWWKATNLGDVANDLYSIVHHEIGHALIFNPANPRFHRAKNAGKFSDTAMREYLGTDPRIDRHDHLDGTVDPQSRRGVFGYEYHGEMPLGRWLITRTDLLAARAVGYEIRDTPALMPLVLRTERLPEGTVATAYSVKLKAEGGVPVYHWEVVTGELPEGLSLDSFTGEVHGQPRKEGEFAFTVQVRDYDERGAGRRQRLRLKVNGR